MNPLISSDANSLLRTVSISSLEVGEEYKLVETLLFVRGIKECSFRVSGIVRDFQIVLLGGSLLPVVFHVAVLEKCCGDILVCPFKQLTYHYLLVIWSLEACSCN